MRKTTKALVGIGVAVAIGAMALGGASLAHRNGGFGDDDDDRAIAMFDVVDSDRDGRLSEAELDKAREDRNAALAAHDADGDGKLGLEEFARLWSETTRPLTVRAFQRLDTDGDAVISRAEYERPLQGIAERRGWRDHHHDRHHRHDD